MRFQIPTSDMTFDVPDDWWRFAEMDGFAARHPSYAPSIEAFNGQIDFAIVPISAIDPPIGREPAARALTKARIVPILLAISAGRELPPVQLRRVPGDRFELIHGYHRYCASIAAGFQAIPGVFHAISWCRPA